MGMLANNEHPDEMQHNTASGSSLAFGKCFFLSVPLARVGWGCGEKYERWMAPSLARGFSLFRN